MLVSLHYCSQAVGDNQQLTVYTIEEIQNFIADKTGCDILEVTADCDIHYDLGCTGDDFGELIAEYSSRFNVKMDGYLWYFHTDEEGQNFGSSFFRPPNERVEHIAVTPQLLLQFANKGWWAISYPEHKLPKRRYDIIINQVLIGIFVAYLIYRCTR